MGTISNKILQIKLIIVCAIILIFSLIICIYSAFIFKSPIDSINSKNARILLNNYVYNINNGNFNSLDNCTYSIYSLDGSIIKTNDSNNVEGSKIDIKTLSSLTENKHDHYITYTAPYIKNNIQEGTIIIKVDYSLFKSRSIIVYIPLILFFTIILICIYYLINGFKRDVIKPINEIHNSAINISKGNLQERISYDYDGEIGSLCHDFENLRLSLDYSIRNEKELKNKEKLLLAYISHDLKTPIATICGYAEGIESGIVKDEKQIKEYSSTIIKKSKLLTKLIDDILIQSKTQLNQFTINKRECYSKAFFIQLISEIKNDVTSKGINFEYSEIPNVLINIDTLRIRQVMQNLISNSIKYTAKNGTIKINFQIYDNDLLVSIIDNGTGIKASDIPMIFNEFYRGEKARTQNIPGSGLGLSISKYIIEKHNGQIECDSILNVGTTITFSLPF